MLEKYWKTVILIYKKADKIDFPITLQKPL